MTALNKVALIALFLFSIPLTTHAAFESFTNRSSEFLTLGPLDSDLRSITISRCQRFGLPELAIDSFSLIAPFNNYLTGLKLWSTGDEIYSEKKISTSFGFRNKKTMLKINLDVYQISLKGYGSESTPGMGFELNHDLTPCLEVSGGVDQLLLLQTNKIHDEIERKLWMSLESHLNKRTVLALSFEKPYADRSSLSLGYEQRLNNNIGFRLSVSDYPFSQGIGLFFNFGKYRFTLSTSRISPLGWSNNAGIGLLW